LWKSPLGDLGADLLFGVDSILRREETEKLERLRRKINYSLIVVLVSFLILIGSLIVILI
jgi:hypothetical protein